MVGSRRKSKLFCTGSTGYAEYAGEASSNSVDTIPVLLISTCRPHLLFETEFFRNCFFHLPCIFSPRGRHLYVTCVGGMVGKRLSTHQRIDDQMALKNIFLETDPSFDPDAQESHPMGVLLSTLCLPAQAFRLHPAGPIQSDLSRDGILFEIREFF